MFEMIVRPPMVTRSGTCCTTASTSAFDIFGKAPLATRRDAIRPRNARRIAGLDLAVSRKLSVGDDVVASAANAGPGFVLVMR
jgi:hypothetical protein